jgi:hypothetical protein
VAEGQVEQRDDDREGNDDDRRQVDDEGVEAEPGGAGDDDVGRVADQRRGATDVGDDDRESDEEGGYGYCHRGLSGSTR